MNNPNEPDLASLFIPTPASRDVAFPRFGNVPSTTLRRDVLPKFDEHGEIGTTSFSLSWDDEEDLGIRVAVKVDRSPLGPELVIRTTALHSSLRSKSLSVALIRSKDRQMERVTIPFSKQSLEDATYTGQGSFGLLKEMQFQPGDTVELDVFLIG